MYRDKEWLRKKYYREGLSMIEISNLCNCSDMTISRWVDRHGIEKRENKFSERHKNQISDRTSGVENPFFGEEHDSRAIELMSGPRPSIQGRNNPNWKEQTVSEYGDSWSVLREEQIQDAGETCQVCGMRRQKHLNAYSKDLHVHHIRPRSEFEDINEANNDENLVVLCISCHPLAERNQILKLTQRSDINRQLAPTK